MSHYSAVFSSESGQTFACELPCCQVAIEDLFLPLATSQVWQMTFDKLSRTTASGESLGRTEQAIEKIDDAEIKESVNEGLNAKDRDQGQEGQEHLNVSQSQDETNKTDMKETATVNDNGSENQSTGCDKTESTLEVGIESKQNAFGIYWRCLSDDECAIESVMCLDCKSDVEDVLQTCFERFKIDKEGNGGKRRLCIRTNENTHCLI